MQSFPQRISGSDYRYLCSKRWKKAKTAEMVGVPANRLEFYSVFELIFV